MSDQKEMKPRLLLVEDDSISCSFMRAALEALPAEVDTAGTLADALAFAGPHDLWLLDLNLPDGSGVDLLDTMKASAPNVPALAHTADDSAELREELLRAGFSAVLVKPLSALALQSETRRWLGLQNHVPARNVDEAVSLSTTLLWDEVQALAALNGNLKHVATLRAMFLDELMRQHDAIQEALIAGDASRAASVLHQLKASSGFVGAMRVQAAATALEKSPSSPDTIAMFSDSVRQTITAASSSAG